MTWLAPKGSEAIITIVTLNLFQGLFAMLLALIEVYLSQRLSTSGLFQNSVYPGPAGPDYRYTAPTGPELLHFTKNIQHVISTLSAVIP